jgi:predicted RNase H-like HicB family nuclease
MSFDVYISRSNRWFVAEVPALPGCRTFGRTEREVLDNIGDVIESCLRMLRRNRQPYPRVKIVRLTPGRSRSLRSA